jgi:hypothetical protein
MSEKIKNGRTLWATVDAYPASRALTNGMPLHIAPLEKILPNGSKISGIEAHANIDGGRHHLPLRKDGGSYYWDEPRNGTLIGILVKY